MKAFPRTNATYLDQMGMDLRDYFAAKAMQGLFTEPDCTLGAHDNYKDWQKYVSERSYEFADAMMEARKNG